MQKQKKERERKRNQHFFFPDVAGKRKIKHVLGLAPCFQREPIISWRNGVGKLPLQYPTTRFEEIHFSAGYCETPEKESSYYWLGGKSAYWTSITVNCLLRIGFLDHAGSTDQGPICIQAPLMFKISSVTSGRLSNTSDPIPSNWPA